MKTYLCSFATPEFKESQALLNKSIEFQMDDIFSYDTAWLKNTQFYLNHRDILDVKLGGGLYAWKPYIILESLKKIQEGDILFYCDSGIEVLSDLRNLIPLFRDGFFFLRNPTQAKNYTKRDCFIYFHCDSQEAYESYHVVGGLIGFEKNDRTMNFVKDWMIAMTNKNLCDTEKSILGPEMPELIKHTFDQAILSLLVFKYNLESYPIFVLKNSSLMTIDGDGRLLLDVHRRRDRNIYQTIKYRIKMITPVSFKNRLKVFLNKL